MNTKSLSLQKYRATKKGVVRNIFSHIKVRCVKYNRVLSFTSDQLLAWCLAQESFHNLFTQWEQNCFSRSYKPSIDRINPIYGYSFDNIQLLTYQENRDKGDAEKELLWGKPIIQLDSSGGLIKKYPSIKQAVKETKLSQGLISMVLSGKRNHTGGFKFQYDNPELVNPPADSPALNTMLDPNVKAEESVKANEAPQNQVAPEQATGEPQADAEEGGVQG